MRWIIAFFLTLTFFSCKKPGDKNSSLNGNWILKESYIDPGDGSGDWAPPMYPASIHFGADGTFSGTSHTFGGFDRYVAENDSVLTFRHMATSNSLTVRYKLNDSKLEINAPCFEGCGFRFNRAAK